MAYYGFGIKQLERFFSLLGIILSSPICAFLIFPVLGLCFLEEYLAYRIMEEYSNFYVTLGGRDREGFKDLAILTLSIVIGQAFTVTVKKFVSRIMIVQWRKRLTSVVHDKYFKNINIYQLNVYKSVKSVDNPDQRITADLGVFTETFGTMLSVLIIAPFTIGYYTNKGYNLSGWLFPVCCFGYFAAASLGNLLLLSPAVNKTYKQDIKEGDFRYKHVR